MHALCVHCSPHVPIDLHNTNRVFLVYDKSDTNGGLCINSDNELNSMTPCMVL